MPIYDKQGNLLGTDAIAAQLRDYVVPLSEVRINRPVNLVSSDGRDEWADVYQRLKSKFYILKPRYCRYFWKIINFTLK